MMTETAAEIREAERPQRDDIADIRKLWDEMLKAQSEALDKAREIGERLTAIKKTLTWGAFEDWVGKNCPFSERHAQNMMKIAKEWKAIAKERKRTPHLSLRAALHLLTRAGKRAAGQDPDKPPTPKKKRKPAGGKTVTVEVSREHAQTVAKTLNLDADKALEFLAAVAGRSLVLV